MNTTKLPAPGEPGKRERFVTLVTELSSLLFPEDAEAPAPPAPEDVTPLVDKREIARLLAVSVATVDRLDRDGQPHVRVGDAKRYEPAVVLAWHRGRTAPPLAPANEQPVAAGPGVRLLRRGSR